MNSVTVEQTIDVRTIQPREKHPSILRAWTALEDGGALVLLNDHDPLPLYYQFACEHPGGFHWEYLDRGPDLWRVRICKGQFPDPGFSPLRASKLEERTAAPLALPAPCVVDTRPIFERGGSPCGAIDNAVASLLPNQSLVLLVPFEPAPLYAKLGHQGFRHQSRQEPDGSWRVEFQR